MFGQPRFQRRQERARSYEFWHTAGPGYAALSTLSDPDDWAEIINSVAREIAFTRENPVRPRSLLDLGAGTGHTALRVVQRLLNTYRIRCSLSLVEPDETARSALRLIFPEARHVGGATILGELGDLGKGTRLDCVMCVHSSYYIADLDDVLCRLSDSLAADGKLVFVAMSRASPFFLGLGPMGHMNVAEDIEECLKTLNFETTAAPLVSRLTVPAGLWEDEDLRTSWLGLFPNAEAGLPWKERLEQYLIDGIDLCDRLIVAQRVDHGRKCV